MLRAAEIGTGVHIGAAATLTRQQLHEPSQLQAILRMVGKRVGSDEDRVAASTLQYGFSRRYWSLVLGAWQHGGVMLDLRDLGYVVDPAGLIDLSVNEFHGWDCTALPMVDVAEIVAASVIAEELTGFHAALRRVSRVAEGLLWGNAASTLSSGARKVGSGRSDDRVTPVATALLARAPLRNKMVLTAAGVPRRTTCCLWYRTRDRTKCASCPLTDRVAARM